MQTHEIVGEIRRSIEAGELRYRERLPAVREAAARYEASQQTVAAAYATLAALGLVSTKPGSGTTVAVGKRADAHLGTFSPPDLSAAEAWKPAQEGGQASEETTLVRQIGATKEMESWGIPEGSAVVERTRIRSVDGVPVQHKLTVIPYDIAAKRPEGYDGVPPMLAPVGAPPTPKPKEIRMADWLGWDVSVTRAAITAEPMNPAATEALGVPEGSPGFKIVNLTLDASGGLVYATVTTAPLHHRVTLDIIG